MTRKIVQTGSSLAVTLPKGVVDQFKLKKGDPVEVSVHPQTGAIVVRAGPRTARAGRSRSDSTSARRSAGQV